MVKLDMKTKLRHLYLPSAKDVVLVDVPPMNFAMIDGVGSPNTSKAYVDSLEALFAVSYTLKFAIKKAGLADYSVMPPEGLWWTNKAGRFSMDAKDEWKWRSMIMQPDVVSRPRFDKAVAEVREKRNPPALSKMRFARFHEGPSVQIMHIGPYAEEQPTIEKLHDYIVENGYKLTGKHHEIYLGDPRRTAPSRLKTVIRQPVRK